MFKEFIRVKGYNPTAGEVKEVVAEEYDEFTTDLVFEDVDLEAPAVDVLKMSYVKEDGYTIFMEEVY